MSAASERLGTAEKTSISNRKCHPFNIHLGATTFSITTLSVMVFFATLSIISLSMECHYAECRVFNRYADFHYAECRYAGCRGN
jgi:hypothetical protein